ncbi:MAG TPA: queuosine precursor transporter [Burkholderiales bacterium]
MAAFVAVLLCSNLIGPAKVAQVGGVQFGAATLFFPISYIFGDILTEVYGYARARRVVWMGFAAMIFASVMAALVVALPPAPQWPHQAAYETVFGATWRVAIASLAGFWAGEFCNSYVLARLKVQMAGRHLWLRLIGSTLVGEGVDTLIFFPLALYGLLPDGLLASIMLTNYVLKCAWEILATPLTYKVVEALKRAENEDYYDRQTNFNPFRFED